MKDFKPKRILIDMTPMGNKPRKSQDTYILRLLNGYLNLPNRKLELILLIRERTASYIEKKYPQLEYKIVKSNYIEKFVFSKTNYDLPLSYKWRKVIKESAVEIILCPYTDLFHYYKSPVHKIQVIHDIYGKDVTYGIKRFLFKKLTPLLIKNADSLIAISNYVRQSVETEYEAHCKKPFSVIYNSVPSTILKNIEIKDSFILYVSTLQKYKNIFTLLKAFNAIKNDCSHKLIIVGKSTKYWEKYCLPYIKEHDLESRVTQLSNISSDELENLYKSTSLYILPSLFEGFGYTPIEAAIFGAPVLTSKCGAIEEVTCGIVNYYNNPLDYIELSQAILSLLLNPPTKKRLDEIRDCFVKKYSMEMQATKYEELLLKLYP